MTKTRNTAHWPDCDRWCIQDRDIPRGTGELEELERSM